MERQLENGEWLQEGIEGVFNKVCTISFLELYDFLSKLQIHLPYLGS